jgi:hypothetical protein
VRIGQAPANGRVAEYLARRRWQQLPTREIDVANGAGSGCMGAGNFQLHAAIRKVS